MSQEQRKLAWKVYRARSTEYAKFNLEALYGLNHDFADFVAKYMGVCCSIDMMQKGFARRGLLTSNPCEQLHSAWVRAREEPIMETFAQPHWQRWQSTVIVVGMQSKNALTANRCLSPRPLNYTWLLFSMETP